ncbi:MAG: helix-turn-helix domain-containing protein [Micrococcales bacterium]|nr:helix-turn-helix domain-containing protein [Micrococcales bacterium]
MFVITADQVGSRTASDRVDSALATITAHRQDLLSLPPERTAGDELQCLTADAGAALGIVCDLARAGGWSIGMGIGTVRTPLGATTRASTGAAFIAAREAVERARRSPGPRLGVVVEGSDRLSQDLEGLIAVTLLLRERRTIAGWAVADLLAQGLTQREIAERIGITPQAVSQRTLAAGVRSERQAVPALIRLLRDADRRASAETGRIGS